MTDVILRCGGTAPGPLAVTCTKTGDIRRGFITQKLGDIANGTDIPLGCKEERSWGREGDPLAL